MEGSSLGYTNFRGADLRHVNFWKAWVQGADFTGANLSHSNFYQSIVDGADFSFADTRGASTTTGHPRNPPGTPPVELLTTGVGGLRNTIMPDGSIQPLRLNTGEVFLVRDYDVRPGITADPIAIGVYSEFYSAGSLRFILEGDAWDSTISFQPGIPVSLGGELELAFAAGVDPAAQIGRTFDLFDWTGVNPTGTFNVMSDYAWDTSRLYTTGEVAMIPEPGAAVLLLVVVGMIVGAAQES